MRAQGVAQRTVRRLKDPTGSGAEAKGRLLALLEQTAARLKPGYVPSSPAEWVAAKWYGVDVPAWPDARAAEYLLQFGGEP